MNYKIGDRVNYTGKLYVIKNPQGVITGIRDREVNRPIDILFDGYDESLCCYESEIRSATISFDKFTAFIDNIPIVRIEADTIMFFIVTIVIKYFV